MDSDPELVVIENVGAVRRIVLNRAKQRNAQSQSLLQNLDSALQAAESDASVNVVVIAADGEHFSAGHDLKEAQEKRAGFSVEERWQYEQQHYFDYCMRIYNLQKPTIAEVQGGCIAAGFMVANMCDLVVASEDAFFADPVVHSIGAAAVEVLIHPWVLGLRKAKEFLYTGASIKAEEAYRIGMVNKLTSRTELTETTMELALRIAAAPPFGVRLTKRSLNRAWDIVGFRSTLEAHFDTHQLSHMTDEMQGKVNSGLSNSIKHGKELSAQ